MSPRSRHTAFRFPSAARHLIWLLLVGITTLMGCQTLEMAPTPTATRTPILPTPTSTPTPTATPLPTSTPTPTPTPTLPPELLLPPSASVANACPLLPTDLYFLREGTLWTCPAEGNTLLEIPTAEQAHDRIISAYHITPDQRRIAYITEAGELYVLDRASSAHTYLPTAGNIIDERGAFFDITPDGGTVIYLSWGVQIDRGPAIEGAGTGALLSISVDDPRQMQQHVGSCGGNGGGPCQGFQLSPDGSRLVVLDGRGLWRIDRDTPDTPHLLAHSDDGQSTLILRGWSPDGQYLLIEALVGDMPARVVLSIEADDVPLAPSPLCSTPCEIGTAWALAEAGTAELWVTWDTPGQGCYARIPETTAENVLRPVQPADTTCGVAGFALHPRSPLADSPFLPSGTNLTFLQAAGPRLYGGIYAVARSAAPGDNPRLAAFALIPDDLASQGHLLWNRDGSAFIHELDDGQATVLGVAQPPALWEVRNLLKGATDFTWAEARP